MLIHLKVFGYMFRPHCGHLQANIYGLSAFNVRTIWGPIVCTIVMCIITTVKTYIYVYAHWRHLICICWPEDGHNAVETCSQKLLNVLALTIVCFIILLLRLTRNVHTCIVTQRDGFRQKEALYTCTVHVISSYVPRMWMIVEAMMYFQV